MFTTVLCFLGKADTKQSNKPVGGSSVVDLPASAEQ